MGQEESIVRKGSQEQSPAKMEVALNGTEKCVNWSTANAVSVVMFMFMFLF